MKSEIQILANQSEVRRNLHYIIIILLYFTIFQGTFKARTKIERKVDTKSHYIPTIMDQPNVIDFSGRNKKLVVAILRI